MDTATKLTRDLDEAMLGGVLAGIALQNDWDPTLARLVAVLVTLLTGVVPGILVYLAAWVLIPLPSGTMPAPGDAPPASEGPPPATPAIADEMASSLRDAADRMTEAATIAAEAARQAANEIGEVARRPRGSAATATEEPDSATEDEPGGPGATDEVDTSVHASSDQPDVNEPERLA